MVNVRGGRGSLAADNNTAKSVVGRVVYSPLLGVEIGGSVHTGKYDEDNNNRLTIGALDVTVQRGPFELLGEGAFSSVETGGANSIEQIGFYLQPNYHFGFGLIPGFPQSKFTVMGRLGYLDYNSSLDGAHTLRYTAGMNWRPIEDTALKLEYQVEQDTPAGSTSAMDPEGTFFFGITSYF